MTNPEHPATEPLLTPEQVAAANPPIGAWWIREQCRRGRVEHLRLGKRRIAFTAEQVAALIAYATQPATTSRPLGVGSLQTARSAARARSRLMQGP